MTPTYECIHEEQIQNQSRKLEALEVRVDYKHQRLDELNDRIEKMDKKIDKINDNVNKLILQSKTDDTELDKRLTAIETELLLQKQKRVDDHNSTMRRIAYWGIVFTVITILINLYFNMIH